MRISDWSSDVCSSDLRGACTAPIANTSARAMNATRCRMHNGHGSSSRLRCEKIANASSDEHASVPNTNCARKLQAKGLAGIAGSIGVVRAMIDYDTRELNARCSTAQIGRESSGERVCQYV